MAESVLPENLRRVREQHNDSLRYLADVLDTTHVTLHSYETGGSDMPSGLLLAFCEHYGVSANEMLGLRDEKCLLLDGVSEAGQKALYGMYDYIKMNEK